MDLRHKHHALIWTGVLLALFLGILGWFLWRDGITPPPTVPDMPGEAISTPDAVLAPPRTLTESSRFYEVRAKYPSATPLSEEANTAALAVMEAFVREQARQLASAASPGLMTPEEAEFAFPGGRKYTLDIDYKTTSGTRTVSYIFTVFTDTLGAHPNTSFRTFTFDTNTGAQLALGDLFLPDSSYLERLSIRSRNELARTIADRTGTSDVTNSMLVSGTEPVAENFQWFRIEGSSLVLVFPPYQVGPYVLGTLEVSLPLVQLGEILKPTYRP